MKSFKLIAMFLAVLGFSLPASALVKAPKTHTEYLCNDGSTEGPYVGKWTWATCPNADFIDEEEANSAADDLTFQIDVRGFSKVNIATTLVDADASGTNIEITCSGSLDGGTTYFSEVSKAVASGTATLSDYEEVKAIAAGTNRYMTQIEVMGYTNLQCIYSFSGTPGAIDLLSVQLSKTVGY